MAKSKLRLKAREMRARGKSVRNICSTLNVSKSTASSWTRDIILSIEQLENLRKNQIKGGARGRELGALMQKQKRLNLIEKYRKEGVDKLHEISNKELTIIFLALYWAEGSKRGNDVRFCNSDPRLINAMINCLSKNFDVTNERFSLRVGINEVHRAREGIVKKHWAEITNIPLSQFRKTSFKKSKPHKVYENFNEHYGTLDVTILKSAELYYKIMGLIEGLASQGSSMVVARHS